MPRKPTTDVIEHRITLGTWERQRADELLSAIEFKQIASPIVDVISDKDAIVVVSLAVAAIAAITGITLTGIGLGVLLNKYGEELEESAKESFDLAIKLFWEATFDDFTGIDEAYIAFKIIYDQYEIIPPSIISFATEWFGRKLPNAGGDGEITLQMVLDLIRN